MTDLVERRGEQQVGSIPRSPLSQIELQKSVDSIWIFYWVKLQRSLVAVSRRSYKKGQKSRGSVSFNVPRLDPDPPWPVDPSFEILQVLEISRYLEAFSLQLTQAHASL